MASTGLRAELECSVCLNIYADPVMLTCGHNFCRVCIDCVLDKQAGSGGYSCPECREEFRDRPALHRSITLRNIVENFLSAQPHQEELRVFCTHCVDSPVAAVKSCLHCEVSLCDKHLSVHKRSPEHILTDPSAAPEKRKCSIHKKILEYYCTEDSTCTCVSCCLIGEHKGHQMESLDEASDRKKKKLRKVLQKLQTEREDAEERVLGLQDRAGLVEAQTAAERTRVSALFNDLRRQLEELEVRVLSEISGQEEQLALKFSDLIHKLELKKKELSKMMLRVEELCNMTDPLTVLQEPDLPSFHDSKEAKDVPDTFLHDGEDLDLAGFSHTLHMGLFDLITGVNEGIRIEKASDLSLDVDAASNKLQLSEDRKSASRPDKSLYRLPTPNRFQSYPQVVSTRSFSIGRYYWEFYVGGSESWRVGVCYPSMDRTGEESHIGNNEQSWGLYKVNHQLTAIHDSHKTQLPTIASCDVVRVYLDYEAGRISFYNLCHPIRHLHTFTATFAEPLLAVLGVWKGGIRIYGGENYPKMGGYKKRVDLFELPQKPKDEILLNN